MGANLFAFHTMNKLCSAQAKDALIRACWCPSPPPDDAPILLVHDASNLHLIYAVCDTVFMANSLAPGCTGESLAAPTVAGCAVMVGPHAGPSTIMVEDLNSAAVVAAEEAAAAVRSAGEWQQRCAPVIAAWSGFFDGDAVWGHAVYDAWPAGCIACGTA